MKKILWSLVIFVILTPSVFASDFTDTQNEIIENQQKILDKLNDMQFENDVRLMEYRKPNVDIY